MGKLVISGRDLTDSLFGGKPLEQGKLQYRCLSCGDILNREEFYKGGRRQYFQAPRCTCGNNDWEVSYAPKSML